MSQYEHLRGFPRLPVTYKLEQDIFFYIQSNMVQRYYSAWAEKLKGKKQVQGNSMQIRTKGALVRTLFLSIHNVDFLRPFSTLKEAQNNKVKYTV